MSEAVAVNDVHSPGGPGRRIAVLGVDDDQDHLFILETMLRRVDAYSVEVTGHTDHKQVLDTLRRKSIDLLVIDYDLKTALATSLIDTIRREGFRQPVLVLTGVGNESIAAKVMKAGASDYIVKSDLSPELLRLAIDGALGRQRLEAEKAILERELLESQKMEAIGMLVGGIAFEFNNLLTVILSEVELGLMKPAGGVTRHLQRIQETGHEMAGIVRRLVAFDQTSRESSGRGHLGTVVAESCGYLQHILPRTIQLDCDTEGLALRVDVWEGAVRQMLVNLALNAAEAMPAGGQIAVRSFTEQGDGGEGGLLPEHLRARRAVIEVRDTGHGIPVEIRPRIFEPFFTTKEFSGQKGCGLGLSMVWQHVHTMRGHIQVLSEVDQGTTFRIFLPVESEPRLIRGAGMESGCARQNERILQIGGDVAVAEATERLLVRLGYQVNSVRSAVEAIRGLEDETLAPSAIVLDLNLPDMAPFACALRLRALRPGVPVIAVTAAARVNEEDVRIEKLCGGPILRRPLRPRDLGLRIQEALAAH